MRIATWNVNSLKARMDKVEWWLKRAEPDVLLMQETKLSDSDAPTLAFSMAGYDLIHHGEGRWNGVAVAVRHGMSAGGVLTNFGLGGVRDSSAGASASVSLVSCMSRMSGAALASQLSTASWRAFSELTFHVAIRIDPPSRLSSAGRAGARGRTSRCRPRP